MHSSHSKTQNVMTDSSRPDPILGSLFDCLLSKFESKNVPFSDFQRKITGCKLVLMHPTTSTSSVTGSPATVSQSSVSPQVESGHRPNLGWPPRSLTHWNDDRFAALFKRARSACMYRVFPSFVNVHEHRFLCLTPESTPTFREITGILFSRVSFPYSDIDYVRHWRVF